SVGRGRVQLVGLIDDDDTLYSLTRPRISTRSMGEKTPELAHLFDGDVGRKALILLHPRPPYHQQTRMRQRPNQAEGRRFLRQLERCERGITQCSISQCVGREAVAQRRLADALRPGQKPGVMHTARRQSFGKLSLDGGVAKQLACFPGMRKTVE